jgi:phosphoenolpyruvate synthase/pyruvate phosphate dikinase
MEKKIKSGDLYFIAAEITHDTIFMMGVPGKYFIQKWHKIGLGNYLHKCYFYFQEDFCQMWFKRSEWEAQSDFLANKVIKNPDWALKNLRDIEFWSQNFMKESNKFIKLSFSEMNNQEIIRSFKKVFKWHELSHGMSTALTWVADAEGEKFSKRIIKIVDEQIKKRKLKLNTASTFSILSTSTQESFTIREEKELLKITQKIIKQRSTKSIFQNFESNQLEEKIKEEDQKTFKLLYKHYQKWSWLLYGYKGPAYTFEYFLERWQVIIQENVSPSKVLKKIIRKEEKIKMEQKQLLQKLKFNNYQLKLLKIAQEIIFIKEFRKGALYHGMYCYEPCFKEISRRLCITINQVWAMNLWEIFECLKNKKVNQNELNSRLQEAICCVDRKKYFVYSDKKAKKIFNRLLKEKIPNKKEVQELNGTCACPGYAQGRVKIIEIPEDMIKMERGDILVSETTYPSLVPAMKKASAIVTNAGGLTCHAAIVSRELKIPCVVGTKIANKILDDGDLVEVDATKGIVKKI